MYLVKTTYFGGCAADDFSFSYQLFSDGVMRYITKEEYYTFKEAGVPVTFVDDDSVRKSKSPDEVYS